MSVLNSAPPAALGIAYAVVGATVNVPRSVEPPGCLATLVGFALLSILSFLILRVRSLTRRSGTEKSDFINLRSTGKTIVKQSDDDDSDPPGGVN